MTRIGQLRSFLLLCIIAGMLPQMVNAKPIGNVFKLIIILSITVFIGLVFGIVAIFLWCCRGDLSTRYSNSISPTEGQSGTEGAPPVNPYHHHRTPHEAPLPVQELHIQHHDHDAHPHPHPHHHHAAKAVVAVPVHEVNDIEAARDEPEQWARSREQVYGDDW